MAESPSAGQDQAGASSESGGEEVQDWTYAEGDQGQGQQEGGAGSEAGSGSATSAGSGIRNSGTREARLGDVGLIVLDEVRWGCYREE